MQNLKSTQKRLENLWRKYFISRRLNAVKNPLTFLNYSKTKLDFRL